MDPATIIGTTSAILSFVQFSGKIISSAVQIHKSASGASEDNQKFADVIANFNERLERLRQDAGNFKSKVSSTGNAQALNDAEKQLLATIKKCEELARKIASVLEKTNAAEKQDGKAAAKASAGRVSLRKWLRPRNAQKTSLNGSGNTGPTLSETMRAAVQTVWQKEAVEELRKDWESCSIQLDQAIFRFENSNRLEILYGVLQQHSADLLDIRDLVRTLVQTSDRVAHLQSFLHDMREADSLSSQEKRNHEKILDALNFPGMYARRDQVADAAGNTFAWLIEDGSIPDELSHTLAISLRQWLATGRGVFHITGKPGSGKSTLMKFIDESPEADSQLQQWAVGNSNKGLIRASCYLWKAAEASRLQNELEGLSRTLLFQILQQEPYLTSVLFKAHPSWDPKSFTLINCVTNSRSTAVTLGPQEILAALESVLAISDHQFFLLIDGLDEMKNTRQHEHKEIAERILHWSTHNSGNVKICVSSREDRAFVETFPGKQRLQLHAVTSEDINTLVELKLERHQYLTSEERGRLAVIIAHQAGGVFLWVVLAIGNLMPLFNARQGVQRLERHVRALPEEMNDFLAETLKRIPECYKKEAWAVFTALASINTRNYSGTYPLIYYSMLEKCLESSGWRIDEQEEAMGEEDIAQQLQEFASRFSDLSSGLLETPETLAVCQPLSVSDMWNVCPVFSHRSVHDFLKDHPDKLAKALAVPRELQRLSGPELVMRSIIQVVICFSWKKLKNAPGKPYGTSTIWPCLYSTTPLNSNQVFPLVKILDEVVLRKQGVILDHQQFNETRSTELRLDPHTTNVFIEVLTTDFSSYNDWAQENGNYPAWISSKEFKTWTVEKVFHNRCHSRITYTDSCLERGLPDCRLTRPGKFDFDDWQIEMLHERQWLSYNDLVETDHSLIPMFSPVLRGSLWLHLLIALLLCDSHVICDELLAKHCRIGRKDGVSLDVQFEWWFDCYSPGQSSSVPRISAGDGDVFAGNQTPSLLGFENQPEDQHGHKHNDEMTGELLDEPEKKPRSLKIDFSDDESEWSGNDTESESKDKSSNGLQDKPQGESDNLREWIRKGKSRGAFPPGSCFGMTVKMGHHEEPQLIQGPQWIDIQDNELLPKFVATFNKAAGTTTLKDILKMWVTKALETELSRDLFEKWASEVREGREDLATAREGLIDDIFQIRMEESMEMENLLARFPTLYEVTSMLEVSSSPMIKKELSGESRHSGEGETKELDNHESRQALNYYAVDVLKDIIPIMSEVCRHWSVISVLCLGLLLAVIVGLVFHQV